MGEPGGLQSMGSRRVGHGLSNFTFTFHFHALEKAMATHSSVLAWRIPGTGFSWWAALYGVAQSLSSNSSSLAYQQLASTQAFYRRGCSIQVIFKSLEQVSRKVVISSEGLPSCCPRGRGWEVIKRTLLRRAGPRPWEVWANPNFLRLPPGLGLAQLCPVLVSAQQGGGSQPGKPDRMWALDLPVLRAQGPYEGTLVLDSHFLTRVRALRRGSDPKAL